MTHPSPPNTPPLRLILGGDLMLGRGVNEIINLYGHQYPLELLAPHFADADLVLANLECAFASRDWIYAGPRKAFYFRADPLAIQTLANAPLHLVSLANNHALDADYDGLAETIALLDAHHIAHTGAGDNLAQARTPALLESRGFKIGVIACCDHQHDFAATPDRAGIDYLDLASPSAVDALCQRVADLAASVDHAIVSIHWQPNWARVIEPMYRFLGHRLIEAGARLVHGHSPHHFQGVEWVTPHAAILYSTGDLLDDYATDPEFRNDHQLLFQADLDQRGLTAIRALPIMLDYARTRPAEYESRDWIIDRFTRMCRELGSHAHVHNHWLTVPPTHVPAR